MTTAPYALTRRSSRFVWLWCVAYTTLTPRVARERRRTELRSHLWESEDAGLASRSVVWAAVRGVVDDVGWTLGRGAGGVARSFGTPTPYVVLALVFPVQGWLVSSVSSGRPGDLAISVGGWGGPAMLLAAFVVWRVHRGRS